MKIIISEGNGLGKSKAEIEFPCSKLETPEEDVACLRAVLERLLSHFNSQLFLDYQQEKFGRIVGSPKANKDFQIEVYAWQEFGKPTRIPKLYTFCCWKSLAKWLNNCSDLYGCEACGRYKE